MTSLAEERIAQQRWTDRLRRPVPAYDAMVETEFEDPERRLARTRRALSTMLRFAAMNVPYYKRMFQGIGAEPDDPDTLNVFRAIPILRKLALRDEETGFHAENMPAGEKLNSTIQSSGTTGMPVRTRHTVRSHRMFALLKQRDYRWARFDPAGTLAMIRPTRTMARLPDGRELPEGETLRLADWPYVYEDFETGPALGFSILNSPDLQLAWLRRMRPDHLLVLSGTVEHLAFAAGGERPCQSLKGVLAISEQLTPDMRAHVEKSFGVPVHQNYGLNEIGIVASRCEAGRYHVHSEHCLVELIGEDGQAVAPGQVGRLVLTGLSNFAMPLLRYDADDLAVALDGPCPCGRTLPSFGEIMGRYTRLVNLPRRSFAMLEAVRGTILKMRPEMIRDLRQFQLHQFRDGSYELRLMTRVPLPAAFVEEIDAAWAKTAGTLGHALSVKYVDAIERAAGGKYQAFTSDFLAAR
jgi:phenylacetate-CoA ligase